MDESLTKDATQRTAEFGRLHRFLGRSIVTTAIVLLLAAIVLQDHIRTLHSLRRVPGTNAYVMDYYVDYNLAEVRAHGIDVSHVEDSFINVYFPKWIAGIASRVKAFYLTEPITTMAAGEHCSTVVLHTDGHTYMGRNFDYSHDAFLIVKVHGQNDEESVAVLDLHYLNLDRDDLDQTNLIERLPLLFAPYYLHDGMNRYGVAVSEMAVDGVRPPYDPSKPNVIQSTLLRLILDDAKNVDEAIELVKQFNVHFVAETCHMMIADASGKSVVLEFIDGQIKPTSSRESWQVCTNHQLSGKSEPENCQSCGRYGLASTELTKLQGKGAADDVMKIMQSIAQPDWTMWSSVYDLSTGEFSIAYRQHYDQPFRDSIPVFAQSR
jgi:hypothetical protein